MHLLQGTDSKSRDAEILQLFLNSKILEWVVKVYNGFVFQIKCSLVTIIHYKENPESSLLAKTCGITETVQIWTGGNQTSLLVVSVHVSGELTQAFDDCLNIIHLRWYAS